MTSYVQKQLLNNEEIKYQAKVHWGVFITPCVYLLIGLLISSLLPPLVAPYISKIFYFIAALGFLGAYLNRSSTELVITNKRVIAKFGFISRRTFEKHLSGLEGLNFRQGIFGRMIGYGTIMVGGVGGMPIPVPYIENPEEFKRQLNLIIEEGQAETKKAA